ncbi:MAG TPA: class I SAM-dependent methyltransferase [Beijerinckiaceae bacterium]|jgi:SAM-dependent methyltransferase|nr:class I SAM-dependent methyltransferase [Beijerinckiaceae bacterium]
MSVDITDLRAFYRSPLGQVARRLVARAIGGFWGPMHGLRVLGLGYATPYLSVVREPCERTLAFMPASQGVVNWPATGLSASALVDPVMMPLPDASIDRVLVAHALETVESPAELLHEVWRILTPGGRIIVVTPNRRGLWSRIDTTPFGHGQPFSRSQLKALMRETWFAPEAWAETLYVPPLRNRFLLRTAVAWERVGVGLGLPFSGLHVVEATKQFQQPLAVRRKRVRRAARLSPVLVPAPRTVLSPPWAEPSYGPTQVPRFRGVGPEQFLQGCSNRII